MTVLDSNSAFVTSADAGQAPPDIVAGVSDTESDPKNARRSKPDSLQAETYASFWIEEAEFAIPVAAIQEVINRPQVLAKVPMSPPFQIGLFNLRGSVIPLIDLRKLLDYPAQDDARIGKVAIIENGSLALGLLFDDTGEVLQSTGANRIGFQPSADGTKDNVVEGLLKFDNGARVVQVLDPHELLGLKKIPRIADDKLTSKEKNDLGRRLSCLSFELGHTTCAMDLGLVQEVMDVPTIEKCCFSDGYLLGTVNLRGYTLPVIDFRGMFGEEEPIGLIQEALRKRKLLVMTLPEGLVGLLVYSIQSIIPYFDDDVLEFTQVSLPRHDIVKGCLLNDTDELLIMIDSEKLARDPELVRAAQSCQEIYPPEQVKESKAADKKESRRRTFILFSVEMSFALDISCVSEVIERPENLLAPPYSLPFVEGVINLRNELITLINPRLLYGFSGAPMGTQKVLIFFEGGQKYGILVDSVDEIVMTTDASVVDVPSISQKDMSRNISEDLLGCLSVAGQKPGADPVIILNTASLIDRCVKDNTHKT